MADPSARSAARKTSRSACGIVAASNRDLDAAVKPAVSRKICTIAFKVVTIRCRPCATTATTFPSWCSTFSTSSAADHHRQYRLTESLSTAAHLQLARNVRSCATVLENAAVLARSDLLDSATFALELAPDDDSDLRSTWKNSKPGPSKRR